MKPFTTNQIHQFISAGYLKLEHAFPSALADECRAWLWKETQCDRKNPHSWKPLVRVGEVDLPPFVQAANTRRLHAAFDQLIGKERWLARRTLGSFPIRFPSSEAASDTGWHVDASFPGTDANDYMEWRINIYSKGRALLMLFLFSDVSERDAPTVIKVGSHLDVARVLAPFGKEGMSFMELAQQLEIMPDRNTVQATGRAGTVYLCHPFIVHAAQQHYGTEVRFMA